MYKYVKKTRTKCYIVNVKNAVNIDACYDLTDVEEDSYKGCIINDIEYSDLDYESLEPGPIVKAKSYRSRLKDISVPKYINNSSNNYRDILNVITNYIRNYVILTGGHFISEVGDIDIYNRILVELFDPITGASINKMALEKFNGSLSSYYVHDRILSRNLPSQSC